MGKIPTHQNINLGESKQPLLSQIAKKALDFEAYLKSPSGGTFTKKVMTFSFVIDKLKPVFFVKIQT
jgi:hypothetical protein